MKKIWSIAVSVLILTCLKAQETHFELVKELPRELKEVSGLARDGHVLWAISDNPRSDIYKLDESGNIIQQLHLSNHSVTDVEAVAVDKDYVYIGDVGDNRGNRTSRSIIRIPKSSMGKSPKENVSGELISFTFPDEGQVTKKKTNNYDCEAMISLRDSLYVFTKRREDMKTEVYVLPKSPGSYRARSLGVFKTKGLVTDAGVNKAGNELALVGYEEGHRQPFLWILSGFRGNDFFSGHFRRYELTNEKNLDWQVESITYRDDDSFFIACEKTREVPNTVYVIRKEALKESKKGESR